jgi:hypothetical protein
MLYCAEHVQQMGEMTNAYRTSVKKSLGDGGKH